jgi:hypothetical protein
MVDESDDIQKMKALRMGIDKFGVLYKLTANPDMSIRFALQQISEHYPEVEYKVNVFVEKIVNALKKNELEDESYNFIFNPDKDVEAHLQWEAMAEYEILMIPIELKARKIVSSEKAVEIVNEMTELDEKEKSVLVEKITSWFSNNTSMSNDDFRLMYQNAVNS